MLATAYRQEFLQDISSLPLNHMTITVRCVLRNLDFHQR